MKLSKLLLGASFISSAMLIAREVSAQRVPTWARPRRATIHEDRARIAFERLRAFIAAARIDATARIDRVADGLTLGVTPGPTFSAPDAAALPRVIDGLDVWIDGWLR